MIDMYRWDKNSLGVCIIEGKNGGKSSIGK